MKPSLSIGTVSGDKVLDGTDQYSTTTAYNTHLPDGSPAICLRVGRSVLPFDFAQFNVVPDPQ